MKRKGLFRDVEYAVESEKVCSAKVHGSSNRGRLGRHGRHYQVSGSCQ